jgi:NAD(P)-dependent dehydrogenase (short-subunit alcohol dehydrogenase family)
LIFLRTRRSVHWAVLAHPKKSPKPRFYLASDASSFVTGTALVVDGGGLAGAG